MAKNEGESQTSSFDLDLPDISFSGNKHLSEERFPWLVFDNGHSFCNSDTGLAMERSLKSPKRKAFPENMAFGDFDCYLFGRIDRIVTAMELTGQTRVQSCASLPPGSLPMGR